MTQAIENQSISLVPVLDATFPLPWRYLAASEHKVEMRDADDLVTRTLVFGADYDIDPQNDTTANGGALTLKVEPADAEVSMSVSHVTTPDQNYRAIPGLEPIETQLDRFSMKLQQHDVQLMGSTTLVDLSRRWAIERDFIPVVDGKFSSKHWANRSKASAATALNAAEASGVTMFADTYSDAMLALPGLVNGSVVDIGADETRGGYRTRYRVELGVLAFKVRLSEPRIYDSVSEMLDGGEAPREEGEIWRAGIFQYIQAGDAADDHDLDPSDGWPAKLYVVQSIFGFSPTQLGARGQSATVDTVAFRQAIELAKANTCAVFAQHDATYLINGSLWLGNDGASPGITGIFGNQARIINQVHNEPVFDCVGVENGRKVYLTGWRFEGFDSTYKPTCFILVGRPEQASGEKSSGNMVIHGNTVYGHFLAAAFMNVQSESNHVFDNHLFNYHTSGHAAFLTKHDYFENMVCLELETVSGSLTGTLTGPSGAAKVIRPANDLGGDAARVWVQVTSGAFSDGDALAFSGGGTASVDMPDGVPVMGPASPNASLGVEEESTSTHQEFFRNFVNTIDATNDDAVIFLTDWSDATIAQGNNINQANPSALYGQAHVQQDTTRDAALGQGCSGIKLQGNYHHSGHRVSVTYADAINGGGTYDFRFDEFKSAGQVSTVEARVQCLSPSGAPFPSCVGCYIDSDFNIDLANTNWRRAGYIRNHDSTNGAIAANGIVEGEIHIAKAVDTEFYTPSLNRAMIFTPDAGTIGRMQRGVQFVAEGRVELTGKTTTVRPESGTSDTITHFDLPSGVLADGEKFDVRGNSSGETLLIDVSAGNIRSPSGLDFELPTNGYATFKYDAVSDLFYFQQFTQRAADTAGFGNIGGSSDKNSPISTFTAAAVSDPPTQAEVQAVADALQAWTRREKAIYDGLRAAGVLTTS